MSPRESLTCDGVVNLQVMDIFNEVLQQQIELLERSDPELALGLAAIKFRENQSYFQGRRCNER